MDVKRLLGNTLLGLLAVAVVGGSGLVLRDRTPVGDAPSVQVPLASPSAAAPELSSRPRPGGVRSLLVGADLSGEPGEALTAAIGQGLGWAVDAVAIDGAGFLVEDGGRSFAERIPVALDAEPVDVVVLSAGRIDDATEDPALYAARVASVLDAARRLQPQARVVVLSPIVADPARFAPARAALQATSARFGAVYVDSPGRRLLADDADLTDADGSLTTAGGDAVGAEIAAALGRVLPAGLVSAPATSASPSPAA